MTRVAPLIAALAGWNVAGCAAAPAFESVDSHAPVAPIPSDDATRGAPRGPSTTLRQDGPYVVEVWFVRDDGDCLAAIPVTVNPCEAGDAHVLRPVSYVRDVDVAGPPGWETPISVFATACPGVHVEYQVAAGGALDADTVAVAFCVASARIDEPVAERRIRIAPPPAERVVIALPRAETVEYVGARRARLGAVLDLATLPSYDGERTVRMRISRAPPDRFGRPEDVATPDERLESYRVRSSLIGSECLDVPAFEAALTSLLSAALRGDPERRTTVEERTGRAQQYVCGTVTGPYDSSALAEAPAFGVPCLAFTSVVAPGFEIARRVETSYVRGFTLRGGVADPDVGVFTSGISVENRGLRWTPAPEFIPRTQEIAPGVVVDADLPLGPTRRALGRDLPLDGDVTLPLGATLGGGPALARFVSGPAGAAAVTPVR